MTPTLDVLIPHWNAPEDLRSSLESVRSQTWKGQIRLVVVDDGSTGPHCMAAQRITSESKIEHTFLRNETNRGRAYTRNRLLDSVESTHAAWLDAGDAWYPEKLALQFAELARLESAGHDADLVWMTCDYDWRLRGQAPIPALQDVTGDQIKHLLLGDRLRAYLWTLLTTKASLKRVGPFDERLPRLQDIDFFLRFLALGGSLRKPAGERTSPLCVYQKSHVGRDARQVYASQRHIFDKHRALYRSYGRAFERQCHAKASLMAARFALENRDWSRVVYYLASALSTDPAATLRRVTSRSRLANAS